LKEKEKEKERSCWKSTRSWLSVAKEWGEILMVEKRKTRD
jgi:hypothetical protein